MSVVGYFQVTARQDLLKNNQDFVCVFLLRGPLGISLLFHLTLKASQVLEARSRLGWVNQTGEDSDCDFLCGLSTFGSFCGRLYLASGTHFTYTSGAT